MMEVYTGDRQTDRILNQFVEYFFKKYGVTLYSGHIDTLMNMGFDLFIEVVNENFDMTYPNSEYDVEYAYDKFLYEKGDYTNRQKIADINEYLYNDIDGAVTEVDYSIMLENIDNNMIMECDEMAWDDFMIERLKSWKFTKKEILVIKDAIENGGNSHANFSEIISDYGSYNGMMDTYRGDNVILVEITPYGYDEEMVIVFDKKSFEVLLGK